MIAPPIPPGVLRDLDRHLCEYAERRFRIEQFSNARGRGWAKEITAPETRGAILAAKAWIREFVALAGENGIDPIPVLREAYARCKAGYPCHSSDPLLRREDSFPDRPHRTPAELGLRGGRRPRC